MLLISFAQVMSYAGRILLAIIILLFMITVHEFGHFTAGRMLGFKINEFAIGMGPKIFKKKTKSGMDFSLRAVPLGGFCAFEGEDEAGNNSPGAFNNQKPWKRIIVLFFGAFFNFLSAILIGFIAFSCFGDNVLVVKQSYETSANYATFNTPQGFCEGDVLYSVNGKILYLTQDLPSLIAKADDEMTVEVLRKGDDGKFSKVQLSVFKGQYTYQYEDEDGNTKNVNTIGWGIQNQYQNHRYSFGESIGRSIPYCFRAGSYILETLGGLFTGSVKLTDMGGPISTIDITTQVIDSGFANTLFLIILISVNLAVFNLLPLPALDGARIVFVIIEMIFKKPVNRNVEAIVHAIGLLLLLGLVIVLDVVRYV